MRQRGGGVVPRRHGEAGGVLGGAVDPDVLGGHGGVSLAGSGLVGRDGGLKNRVARGDLDGGGETVAARVRTGSRHRGPQIQVDVAALVPLEVEVDLIGQLQVLRSAGNGFDRADGLTQQGVVQLRDGAQLGVHDQGRGLTAAIVDVEGARPGHFVTVLGGAGPGPLARHGVGLNGDVRGALRGDGRWDADLPAQAALGIAGAMAACTGCVIQPLHGDVGISGGRGCDGCGGEQGKSQGDAQDAPPGKRGWGGWEVHEHAFR